MKLELAEIRSAMREMDVSWEASETEVTPYLEVEGTELFGLNIRESERLSMMAAARDEPNRLLALAPPPSEIDWRDHNGQNWVTDVLTSAISARAGLVLPSQPVRYWSPVAEKLFETPNSTLICPKRTCFSVEQVALALQGGTSIPH